MPELEVKELSPMSLYKAVAHIETRLSVIEASLGLRSWVMNTMSAALGAAVMFILTVLVHR